MLQPAATCARMCIKICCCMVYKRMLFAVLGAEIYFCVDMCFYQRLSVEKLKIQYSRVYALFIDAFYFFFT